MVSSKFGLAFVIISSVLRPRCTLDPLIATTGMCLNDHLEAYLLTACKLMG